ncbi:arylamine N-acetyltransferase 2 [Trichoderma camerunense]
MAFEAFRDSTSQASAYSEPQITAWLQHIGLPSAYEQYIYKPTAFPKTEQSLKVLFRAQITTFPYENLSVHYSPTHLVDIHPDALYTKMMGALSNGRGGYCMELSIFFHHMLRGLGFHVYMTGVRNRTRTNGVPQGETQGWTHINNIIHLPDGSKFSADVAFGGNGPTLPLRMDKSATIHSNLGSQEVRLVYDVLPKQRLVEPKVWIYQYRNGADKPWNSFYSFLEVEFFQEDFEVQNWWASAKTLHRWTLLAVRFLREGETSEYPHQGRRAICEEEINIVGKVMLVNNLVKLNMGNKTTVIRQLDSEQQRLSALWDYFGIRLTEEEAVSINGWDMALTNSS